MKRIIFDADSVWNYHQGNKHILEDNTFLIAENDEYGVEIYLTSDGQYPQFNVIVDDTLQYCDFAMSIEDCRATLNEIYDDYLTENIIQNAINAEIDESTDHCSNSDSDEDIIAETIKSREGQLVAAMLDFLIEAMDSDDAVSDSDFWEKLRDCLEHTLKYISDKGFLVFRPTLVKDEETGKVSLVDFPYKDYDITF